jgi:hypothetical protein
MKKQCPAPFNKQFTGIYHRIMHPDRAGKEKQYKTRRNESFSVDKLREREINMKNMIIGLTLFFILATIYQAVSFSAPEATIDRVIPDISLCTTGQLLTIEGTNLPQESLVYIGKHLIHSTDSSGTEKINALIPDNLPSGTYELRVVSAGQRNIPAKTITLLDSETSPFIKSVSPTSIQRQKLLNGDTETIAIKGSNFSEGATVSIGQNGSAEIVSLCNDLIIANLKRTVPCGVWDLNVTNKNGESGYIRQALTIE